MKVYRPIFWYTSKDKQDYEHLFGVTHSKCYTDYGFKRTGCAGCPFGRHSMDEIESIKDKEPRLYRAANQLFRDSYQYTRMYREYRKKRAEKERVILDDPEDEFGE